MGGRHHGNRDSREIDETEHEKEQQEERQGLSGVIDDAQYCESPSTPRKGTRFAWGRGQKRAEKGGKTAEKDLSTGTTEIDGDVHYSLWAKAQRSSAPIGAQSGKQRRSQETEKRDTIRGKKTGNPEGH